ncbi:pyruvate dehydrogenase E2 component (dihydrolipoamide acetyltransferase) [Panacagrimonas perspica]|uniref:Acetyltransferase component of pyruvate dehydrogenase complex n=1 Tax=Panacagrimonas perspica TaxID=381431 RepID=A0A4V3F5F7_9GAMM|nr:dihydrolipoyllysine-residue acetyltransferase [Panacagrimonas perspica]TDU28806.1 pyruvate dehydrogenase E2 component (dihydrolipoamide acetyltransferase) [Panacagrimonas perspica]THD02359.1 dihydrolipoyllysine-residue acetyltransferase [Panacagrimonas perspica]
MANLIDVQVPDIGDFQGVPVIELLVKDGDTVAKDQALVVLESDKSTMEVPSPEGGVVRGLKVKVGDKLSKGDRICRLELEGAAEPAKPAAKAAAETPAAPAQKKEGKTADKAAARGDLFTAPEPAKAAASSAASASLAVTVPDIGDFQGVPIIELLVKDGDTVEKDQALMVLESDKSTMEVPSPGAGTIRGLKVKVGDKVSKGDALLSLEGAGGAPAVAAPAKAQGETLAAPAAEKPADAQPAAPVAATAEAAVPAGANVHAGPATRKFARELGVDLSKVVGSGPKNRVQIEDVQRFVKQQMTAPAAAAPGAAPTGGAGIPPVPAQDFSLYGEIETTPLARIRKLSATFLHRSWLNVPHVTQQDEADITELEAFRKSASEDAGVKLTLLPFVMKAVAVAIRQYPEMGCSLSPDGGSLIMKKYCHIGFAADTPNGLLVPVVRDVWGKTLTQLAAETAELAKKARDGKLKPDEMKGGCFSISSLGGIGGSFFTPIVNAPEVGILGVSRGVMKPVWDGKAFQPRLMLPLSLSYDHRVIDGAYAARFIVALVKLLGDIRRLSL